MPAPDQHRCKATARTGEQCGLFAIRGQATCYYHGGATPAARAAGVRRVAVAKATARAQADAASLIAHEGLRGIADPHEALGLLAQEVVAMKNALANRVNALDDLRYSAPGTGAEQIRAEVLLLERAQDRAVRILDVLIRSGFEERRIARLERTDAVLEAFMRAVGLAGDQHAEEVLARLLADDEDQSLRQLGGQRLSRLNEDVGAQVAQVIRDVTGALGLSSAQREAVPRLVPAALRAMASGSPFVPPVSLVAPSDEPRLPAARAAETSTAPTWPEPRVRSVLEWLLAGVGVPASDPVARAQAAIAARVLTSGSALPPVVSPSRAWWVSALARAQEALARLGEAPALPSSGGGEGRRVLEGLVLDAGGRGAGGVPRG